MIPYYGTSCCGMYLYDLDAVKKTAKEVVNDIAIEHLSSRRCAFVVLPATAGSKTQKDLAEYVRKHKLGYIMRARKYAGSRIIVWGVDQDAIRAFALSSCSIPKVGETRKLRNLPTWWVKAGHGEDGDEIVIEKVIGTTTYVVKNKKTGNNLTIDLRNIE